MRIEPFAVEQWMNDYETRCRYNLAETCVESITVDELLRLADHEPDRLRDELLDIQLTCVWNFQLYMSIVQLYV